jgi:hypothetical protein
MDTINASTLNIGQSTPSYQLSGVTENEAEETQELAAGQKAESPAKDTLVTSSEDGLTEISAQGDTLSLSEEGLQAATGLETDESGIVSQIAQSGTSSSTSTQDLSSYSDSQLKSMLNNGEITQMEYNKEIASRQAEKQAQNAVTNIDLDELLGESGES